MSLNLLKAGEKVTLTRESETIFGEVVEDDKGLYVKEEGQDAILYIKNAISYGWKLVSKEGAE